MPQWSLICFSELYLTQLWQYIYLKHFRAHCRATGILHLLMSCWNGFKTQPNSAMLLLKKLRRSRKLGGAIVTSTVGHRWGQNSGWGAEAFLQTKLWNYEEDSFTSPKKQDVLGRGCSLSLCWAIWLWYWRPQSWAASDKKNNGTEIPEWTAAVKYVGTSVFLEPYKFFCSELSRLCSVAVALPVLGSHSSASAM